MSGLTQAVRSSFRNIWGHGDDDYADEPDDETTDADSPAPTSHAAPSYSAARATPTYGGGGSNGGTSLHGRPLRAVPASRLRSREKNIYTIKPKTQDDAAIAADYLKTGDAVILNMNDVDRANAVRIIDFMSGVCYGLDGGHAMKLGDAIFLYTPPDYEIRSDEVDYGENPDYFFKDVQPPQAAPTAPMGQATATSHITSQGYTNPAVLPHSGQGHTVAPTASTIPAPAVSGMQPRGSYVDARRPWER